MCRTLSSCSAERMHALFITIDTDEYRHDRGTVDFDPHLISIAGDPAAIAAVAKAYRVYFQKVPLEQDGYAMDHTAMVS